MNEFWLIPLVFVAALLANYVKEYFSSHSSRSGEIDAIADKFDLVVAQLEETTKVAEATRAAIEGGLWVEQEKWKLKRDAYVPLLYNLRLVAIAIQTALQQGTTPSEKATAYRKALKKQNEEDPEHWKAVHRAQALAEVVFSEDSLSAYEALQVEAAALQSSIAFLRDPDALPNLLTLHERAYRTLIEAAKNDLQIRL